MAPVLPIQVTFPAQPSPLARCLPLVAALWLVPLASTQALAQEPGPDLHFAEQVRPLLESTCFRCHGPDEQRGGMRLDVLDPDMVTGSDAEDWALALDLINGGEMPPRKEPQFADAERRIVVAWLTEGIKQATRAQQADRQPVVRRLTKAQYTHSLQDLFGTTVDFGRPLPNDGKSKQGFSNSGEVLQASPLHMDYYQTIARKALQHAIAVEEMPEVRHYRVTFGEGIGEGRVAGHTGGYQSVPLGIDDFRVDILGENGVVLEGAEQDEIKRHISVGLRGSSQERFRIVKEGMLLYAALPHKEKVPAAWQGPSPNLKLEMQRVFPDEGDFVMRVRASRGYLIPSRDPILVALGEQAPRTAYDLLSAELQPAPGALVGTALASEKRENLLTQGDFLIPDQITEDSSAQLQFKIPAEGYFQVDLVHPPLGHEAMPSVRLSYRKLTLDSRPELSQEQLASERVVTTLGAAYLPRGMQKLRLGGPFFTGFSHLVLTPLPPEHELVQRLDAETDELEARLATLTPSIRGLVGTRTDDGMDYATFDEPQAVEAPLGQPQTYTLQGRLENLPIPEPDSGDKEILSGFLLLGLWNDHLVKQPGDPGPPLLVESIEFEAPFLPAWPPASHETLFFDHPDRGDENLYTQAVLARFLERAYRRPLAVGELTRYMDFWATIRPDYESYEESVAEVMVAALCTPNFLFLVEPIDSQKPAGQLDEHSLANRLAFFLWNSPADAELHSLAVQGTLTQNLLAQVDRMLEDPRSWRFVEAFVSEWLRLDRHESMKVNADLYPLFSRFVKRDMATETLKFFHHALLEDLPVSTLVDSDFAMLNQNLAEYYGIEGVLGSEFRPVPIEASTGRGGLLGQGAFLSGHSDGNQAHPIKRAVWVKEKILGDPPPPPPPNVPDLDPDAPGFENLTLKEQLEKHRENPSCVDCHAGIDPFGIVFERFDAGGLLHNERMGKPVDDASILPDGTSIQGLAELKRYLLDTKREDVLHSLVEHLFAYALGRDLSFADDEPLQAIVNEVHAHGDTLRAVVRAIVQSPSFTSSN